VCGPNDPVQAERRIQSEPVFIQREEQLLAQEELPAEPVQMERNLQRAAGQERDVYRSFVEGLTALPENIPVAQGNAPQENLGYKEHRRRQRAMEAEIRRSQDAYKELGKEPRLIRPEELRDMPLFATKEGREKWGATKPKHSKITLRETMQQVQQGDYSNFENLDPVMRCLVATKAIDDLVQRFRLTGNENAEEICRTIHGQGQGVSALLDPALRLGLSLAQKANAFSPEQRAFFLKLDEAMSTAVMTETLTHVAQEDVVAADLRRRDPSLGEDAARAARG